MPTPKTRKGEAHAKEPVHYREKLMERGIPEASQRAHAIIKGLCSGWVDDMVQFERETA